MSSIRSFHLVAFSLSIALPARGKDLGVVERIKFFQECVGQ